MFRGLLFRGFCALFRSLATIVITAVALWAIIHVQYQWFFMGEIFALQACLGLATRAVGQHLLQHLRFALHVQYNSMAVVEAALMRQHNPDARKPQIGAGARPR